jgi:hypothetical protein
MKTVTQKLALAALFLLSAGSAAAGVTVTFVHPEDYSDMPLAAYDRDAIIRQFSDYYAYLGKRLPPGQELKIEVLDIDLAGQVRPNFRRHNDLRVLRNGADGPQMHLRYTLESQGRVVQNGDEQLNNLSYMNRVNSYSSSNDPLRYEKQMIDDWFKKIVTTSKPAI